MNQNLLVLPAVTCLVVSCEKATPRDYFDRAVLNCNLLHGFAGPGLERELQDPSVKLADASGTKTVPMTRKEVVDGRLQAAEEAYEKLGTLPETDETRALLKASLAVYDFVLPVYRAEYQQLARLYDGDAPAKEIATFQQGIRTKYQSGFDSRMEALTALAKAFAEKHAIKVQWDVRTSP